MVPWEDHHDHLERTALEGEVDTAPRETAQAIAPGSHDRDRVEQEKQAGGGKAGDDLHGRRHAEDVVDQVQDQDRQAEHEQRLERAEQQLPRSAVIGEAVALDLGLAREIPADPRLCPEVVDAEGDDREQDVDHMDAEQGAAAPVEAGAPECRRGRKAGSGCGVSGRSRQPAARRGRGRQARHRGSRGGARRLPTLHGSRLWAVGRRGVNFRSGPRGAEPGGRSRALRALARAVSALPVAGMLRRRALHRQQVRSIAGTPPGHRLPSPPREVRLPGSRSKRDLRAVQARIPD